jgi:hypothetical protein
LEVGSLRPFAALALAAILSAALVLWADRIIEVHAAIVLSVLRLSGVPVTGVVPVDVFAAIADRAPAPAFTVHGGSVRTLVALGITIVALVTVHRRVQLARTFAAFVLVVVGITVARLLVPPPFTLPPEALTQMWVRTELLVWLVLPWVTCFLFLAMQPSALAGIGWILAVQGFGIVWSAIRLAFSLATLHHTGVLLVPALWFVLGLLSDVLYVIAFYSWSVHLALMRDAGDRSAWR